MEFFVSAGNATVHIDDYGAPDNSAKTLVLLHGYLETMYIWSQFADLLKDKYRIITIDLPGHGISSTAPDGAPNTMQYCADVVNAAIAKCNIEKFIIAGHSLGGYIAESFAQLYPDKVEKLILFNSHPYPEIPEFSDIRKREISIINSGRLETIASVSVPKLYHPDNLRVLDEKICETLELCEMHDPQGIIASIKGMAERPDLSQWMAEVQSSIPILMICGDSDPFIPSDLISKFKDQFKSVKVIVLEKTGHNSFIEAPSKCAELLIDFIG